MAETATPTFVPGIKAPELIAPARWYLYQGDRLVLGAQVAATLVSADLLAGKVEFRILPS